MEVEQLPDLEQPRDLERPHLQDLHQPGDIKNQQKPQQGICIYIGGGRYWSWLEYHKINARNLLFHGYFPNFKIKYHKQE